MLTFDKFSGINNVLPTQRLKPGELRTAMNVDIGLDNEISRRSGYSVVNEDCYKNLHQGDGFMLATTNGDLKAIGGNTLYQSLGVDRVWYCNLPNGKTIFSNGLIHGVTDGVTASDYGIPIPDSLGAATDVVGSLFAGDYQYQLTYVRLSDGLEGGPLYSNPFPVASGGIALYGLPAMDGYGINVYITSHNAGQGYYAGSTLTGDFSYTSINAALVLPCRTDYLSPPPVGILHTFWRGRVLLAEGDTLWASRTHQHELFDKKKDFKRFGSRITLIQPVDDGIYVGTDDELFFLSGTEFDKLQQIRVMRGAVVLGSGISVPGKLLKMGDGVGSGQAMVCIADRVLVSGFSGGQAMRITEGRYVTTATEVTATFRMVGDIPQYLAIPQ